MKLLIKKLSDSATIPNRASPRSVGYDLYSNEEVTISPGYRACVATGISIGFPEDDIYGRVAPRSGLAVKRGINVGAGVIDPDYTGEIKVVLFNHGSEKFDIKVGDKIAQLIIEKCATPLIEEVDEIKKTKRGSNGFGSSGN